MKSFIIYKYPVCVGQDEFIYILPVGSEFLCVQAQRGAPQMWFKVPVGASLKEHRRFITLPTGVKIDMQGENSYLGSFQVESETMIFHLFELL